VHSLFRIINENHETHNDIGNLVFNIMYVKGFQQIVNFATINAQVMHTAYNEIKFFLV